MKILLALLLSSLALAAGAATPIPPGKWRFEYTDAKGRADRPIRVYTYRPRGCDTKCPIVFVMHGAKRDGSHYRDHWELLADGYKVLIVAPEFSPSAWPRAAAYDLGEAGEQPNPEKWSYSAIEHLFDEVRDGQAGYAIFGHGAGAQFVQRMALLRPDNRATVMVAANPGWYLMPEWRKEKVDFPYPYSLVGSKSGAEEVKRALARRFILIVGDKDDDTDPEGLDKGAGAMKQGEGRVDRGENFFKAATAAALELGVPLQWELDEAPATAHEGGELGKMAARILYGKK